MSEYPNINDKNFYDFINKKYSNYKIPINKKTLKQFCFPKKFELQIPQKFLAQFINPKTPYKGLLIYHRIGSGKTCTAIQIAEKFKKNKKILIVLPASLQGNFRSELRSLCGDDLYLTELERKLLRSLEPSSKEYKDIIAISDSKIDKYYTIYSYNKFMDLAKYSQINLDNTLLIIDEVHNMISETGSYYQNLYKLIHNAPDNLRLIIMSATPIYDKPTEIALTMNLLMRDRQMPIGKEFMYTFIDVTHTKKGPIYKVKNMDLFKSYIRGYISYYSGAPSYTFPKMELHIVKCEMSEFQYKLYSSVTKREITNDKKILDNYLNINIPNSFFIGTRMISNFAYPNKKVGLKGYESLMEDDLNLENIETYSPKFLKIFKKIRRASGTIFIYSNFKEYGGLRVFIRLLEHYGYKNYEYNGIGKKRFGVWSGNEDLIYREELKAVFNNKNNEDGSKIKLILGSSAVKEGVSFLRVQQVHIMEPYWNNSKISQIMGRAIRFCSHKDVPIEKQLVKVYIYVAVSSRIRMTVDQRIMQMALTKEYINSKFEKAMKEMAIDCELFKNANEPDLICRD